MEGLWVSRLHVGYPAPYAPAMAASHPKKNKKAEPPPTALRNRLRQLGCLQVHEGPRTVSSETRGFLSPTRAGFSFEKASYTSLRHCQ